MPGGKSRKSGGISKQLVQTLANRCKEEHGSVNRDKRMDIKRLILEVNEHHRKAGESYKLAVEQARLCGDKLNQLKELVDHGHWKEWLRGHFKGSYERARDYMKLAKVWDNPKLKEARDRGIALGIYAALEVCKGRPLPPGKDQPATDEEKEQGEQLQQQRKEKYQGLMTKFRYRIEQLSEDDTLILAQSGVFDRLWKQFADELHHTVCLQLEYDPDEYDKDKRFRDRWARSEEATLKARQMVAASLNRER